MIQAYFRINSMEASEHNGAYKPPSYLHLFSLNMVTNLINSQIKIFETTPLYFTKYLPHLVIRKL